MTPHISGNHESNGRSKDLNGHSNHADQALIPASAQRPDISVVSATNASSPLDQRAVLASIRRRWFIALVLGLFGGIATAAAAWYVVPLHYTAFAELRIHSARQSVLPGRNHENVKSFEVFRQTQMRLVRGPLVLQAALRKPGIAEIEMLRDKPSPMEWLEAKLDVSSPASEFIRVSLSGADPQQLASVVNAVADAFVAEAGDFEYTSKTARYKELENARAQLNDELGRQRSALNRMQKQAGAANTVVATEVQRGLEAYYTELRKSLALIKLERTRAQVEYDIKSGATQYEEPPIPDILVDQRVLKDPQVARADAILERKRSTLAQYRDTFRNSDHPQVKKGEADVAAAEQALAEAKQRVRPAVLAEMQAEVRSLSDASVVQLKARMDRYDQEVKVMEEQLAAAEARKKDQTSWTAELSAIEKDIEQLTAIQQRFVTEAEQLKLEINTDPRVQPHRPAVPPREPDYARKYGIVGFAGLGVMGMIAGGILVFDIRARRIHSLDEVASGLRLPILGSLPLVRDRAGNRNSQDAEVWQGALMESVDSARVMLLRRASLENAKVAMVASALTSEGKTTLACHLATSLARAGYRTLLVDADMRRPTIHRIFDVPDTVGLCELLVRQASVDEAVHATSQEGLFVIPAGEVAPDALRELAQDGLASIFEELRKRFDFVIVDSSPVLPVTDALLVSQYADGVIFSIRRDVSQYPKVATACQRLSMMGAPLWGAVVIGLDQVPYGYRYSYAYGVYGKTRQEKPKRAEQAAS